MIRLGIVDFDTSHSVEFTKRLNHIGISEDQWVEGAKVTLGFPGTSAITEQARIDAYAKTMSADLGVPLVQDPKEMLGKIDGVLIESIDGSVHLERAKPFLEAGIPIFVDKPFTCSVADARKLIRLAGKKKTALFSSSSLRYGPELVHFLSRQEETGKVVGADAYSPASLHPRNPGFFHYGIHGVETLYTLMGTGCQSVTCTSTDGVDFVAGLWKDGRIGTMRGTRAGGHLYGFVAFGEKKVVQSSIDARFIYRELLKQVVKMFQTGQSPLDPAVTLEIVAFIEATSRSASSKGRRTALKI